MKILVLNAGSSSIKYQVFAIPGEQALLKGQIDRIGEPGSAIASHHAALEHIIRCLRTDGVLAADGGIDAIGHRVVHGGEHFHQPVRIDAQVIAAIRAMIPLAPLHNPANLTGIRAAQTIFPGLPNVGVFDTAFHQTMPEHAYTYAVPRELYRKHGLRRYGFHGTSYRYVAQEAANLLGKNIKDTALVIAHLGNGASVAAVLGGESKDTSMGLTPLEGLVMGTRSG
ncbi:MAG: acetate/propionate family kinase, partial [Thiothrix sp.]|nr:acetate/propionate family kinase [Thiothrix sp.]